MTSDVIPLKQPPRRNRLLTLADLRSMPRPKPLISGVLYSNMEHVLFGPQGVTKTFIAIDWALHMAYQRPWFGIPVEHGKTVYVCGEGGGRLFADRLDAWLTYHEIGDESAALECVRVTEYPVPLLDVAAVDELLANADDADFFVIDSLAANFGGGDENSQADMGLFCNAMRRIRLQTSAGVMVVHHTGHADKTRPQGANILRRSVDIELRVDRDTNDSDLFGLLGGGDLKSRHGKGCGLKPYRLKSVGLEDTDSLGQQVASAVIVPTQDTPEFEGQRAATKSLGKHQRHAVEILKQIADASGQDPGDPEGVYVSSADWVAACNKAGLPKQRRCDVRRSFLRNNWIQESVGGFKWFPM